ncbi:MAG: glycosyltransferase family 39 protein [Lentisphaeria bacterium]|nr:glycosyltransferase family 39 protein [Lentisphaeria bacterium]
MKSLWGFFRTERGWLTAGFVFAAAIFLVNLGSDGIYAAQEGRTAMIVRNMVRSGNYMEMHFEHAIPYEKPIGHYWLCLPGALAGGLGGDALKVPAERILRLPSALCALAAVLAAAFLARRLYGAKTAALTMVVLSATPTFSNLGRLAHIDMPLAAAFTIAMCFLWCGYFEEYKSNARIYGFYIMLGAAVLLKGPLAILLAGCVILGMLLWSRRWKMLWELRPLTGGLVFLAVALPWYIAEYVRTDGAFFDEFIVNQNFRRFTGVGSTYRGGKRMPLYYYFPKLFAGMLPWSLAAIPGAVCFRRALMKFSLRRGTVFLLMWAGTLFIFFSCSALKRGDYLLPLYPAAAVLLARVIVLGCENLPGLTKKWKIFWLGLCILIAAAAVVNRAGILIRFGELIVADRIPHASERDGVTLIMISRFINDHFCWALAGAAGAAALLFLIFRMMERRRYFTALSVFSAAVLGVFTCYHAVIQPGTDGLKTVKFFCRKAVEIIPPGEKVSYHGDFNTELIFFIDRPYGTDMDRDGTRFVLMPPEYADRFLRNAPDAWKEHLRTPEGHQYPAVLLERRK